ncbi:MAG: helix-turn-helix domain-containing protein, partial [Solirubrobacterales bacterium]
MTAMRPELPREFVASHKRRRMMDAIAELTAEQGYEATKIADIVRRAAVARKTLYDNFDGKEDLFL